ncbi:MAG: PhzF family phenazine biosynthesis protein [Bacteroidota bacterium]|nr:PhzF family phenazine biosynthesis protein [Bacteroidota bacterium]MDP4193097.1 PhzF family phenazine biosynthesis protein [Bacteroidota bacterium]MDP4196653.1 PhzF family phenazine biosynthesis protein [Bacteroidota bacterium]
MKQTYKLFQIDAFTEIPFQGNPAAVTFAQGIPKEKMQLIAKEMNLSETAFISASDSADYKLQWMTPKLEVNLCGHATIASLHYLNELGKINNRPRITFETLSGILKCPVRDNTYFMEIPQMKMDNFEGERDDLIDALGIDKNAIAKKFPFTLLQNGYLYIYSESLEALKNMQPDFDLISTLSMKYDFRDICVFTLETYDKNSFAHSRFFAPIDGINEDPVTGSSNGPLLLVLKRLGLIEDTGNDIEKTFEQGDIIGRPGRIKVFYSQKNNELYIGGKAVTIFKGDLII